MNEVITLDTLEKELTFFQKMYDVVRIVDPVSKHVLDLRKCQVAETNEICHNYWKNGKICDNCISIRSFQENKSYMKIEQSSDIIMLVTALPVKTKERPVILELLKNVTDTMMLGTGEYHEGEKMYDLISKMNDLIMKDELTSLYNRRFINERLPVDIIDATITNQKLTVMLLDIDNLKQVNDSYGHSVGDIVIQAVGQALQNTVVKEGHWSARFGGDEFIISLKNTTLVEANVQLQAIHDEINKIIIPVNDANIHVSVSIGAYTLDDRLTAEEVIKQADVAMYKLKSKRKNKVIG